MIKNWILASLALGTLACHGCSDDFDPASRVVNLRVLAVQADKPFAKPGDTVQLSALFHDPKERPLTWAFGICPEADSTSALSCIQHVKFEDLSLGTEPAQRV